MYPRYRPILNQQRASSDAEFVLPLISKRTFGSVDILAQQGQLAVRLAAGIDSLR